MKKVFLLLTLIATTFSAWGADYTVTKSVQSLSTQYGWEKDKSYYDFKLDNAISITATNNSWNNKVVNDSKNAMRYYQNNNKGQMNFVAKTGVTIKSVLVNYNGWNDGTLATEYTNNGVNVATDKRVSKTDVKQVNASSYSLYTGSTTSTRTDGRADVSTFTVTYSDPTMFLEQFEAYPTAGGNKSITGDNGIYKWKINAQNRTQAVGAYSNCIKLQYGQSIASDGNLEGGIKSISFDWRTTGANYPNHFIVKAGSITDDVQIANFNNTSLILTYTKGFNITSNTTLSISNPAQESPAQNHIAVAPVHITPYLLFTAKDHKVAVDCKTAQTYDLKNVLINNTGTTPTYSITSNSCGGYPTISNGVVDLSTVTADGSIGIKATWEGVSTTLTINVTALPKQTLTFATEGSKSVTLGAAPFTNVASSTGDGTISYESSNPSVASVASDGTVTINAVGSAFIKAKAAKTAAYQAAEVSYIVNVARVSPAIAPAEITETKEIIWLSRENGYSSDKCYPNIKFNNAISITAANDNWNNKIVGTYQGGLRYYQDHSKGQMNFVAKSGVTIKSVKATYTGWNDNILAKEYVGNGSNVVADKRIASGDVVSVNANTYSLYTGSTSTNTAARLDVSALTFVYTDPTIVFETFSNYISGTGSFNGDNGIYKWKANAANHTMTVNGYKAYKLEYNNDISTDGVQEGGIKSVSFDYTSQSTTGVVKMAITAGGETYDYEHAAIGNTGYAITYTNDLNIASNTSLSIAVGANAGQAHVAVGPVHITPYLLFNVANHATSINIEDATNLNLIPLLINNTGTTPSFDVIENTAGGNPQINNGILDFSSVVRTGTIKVQAAWEGVTTTLTLTINLKDPKVSFADTIPTEKISKGWYKQALTLGTSTMGSKSYKVVSKPDGATATMSEDTVRFDKAGDYIIRGIIAANLPYAEDSAQYKLHVTDRNVPTLSFAKDTVEQPISASTYKNELTTSVGVGDTTYDSSNKNVATVVKDGTVTLLAAGTTDITAYVAENDSVAAGQKSYFLKVYAMPVMSFADGNKDVYLNQEPFTYAVTKTAGDGVITYESGDENVAEVNNDGTVTIKGAGTTTITANIAKGATYWSGSANYTLKVSSLSMPTASFTESVVNKNQNDTAFTIAVNTNSDGVKAYESSDKRVASVDNNGKVTFGEKPGTTIITAKIAASDTYEKIEASYTLNVSAATVEGWNFVTKTVAQMRGTAEWTGGSQHPNIDIVDGIVLSDGKYYSNIDGEHFRYYYNADPKYVSSTTFTIQAKAGVIIQTVKINYIKGNDKMVLAYDNYNGAEVPSANRIISGTTYNVDANSVTYYVGRTGTLPSANNFVNVTGYEIKYFDPATGVAVTKTSFDLGKDLGLISNLQDGYQDIKVNDVISLHADKKGTLKYYSDANSTTINCYRWTGPIDIKARQGATIHHVKITYNGGPRAVLTKYQGTQSGYNIPAVDRIASDSVLYVNANSLRLYVGDTLESGSTPTIGIKKIYVNYTDNSEVTVDNFDNCESTGTGGSVNVAGVDGKYNWSIYNFSRADANRMYYDQSIKLNKGGKIVTNYTGGLKEVAFDWHPTESGKVIDFTVTAGDSSWTVKKTADEMDKIYTFNFQKLNIKTNGEFSIKVNSDAAVEIGHVSLTPYLLYASAQEEIDAKNYKDAGWKYIIANTLTNYTGKDVTYSITNGEGIASIEDPTKAEVTILGGGTVTVNATADGATASYQLKINLEETSASFANKAVEKLLIAGSAGSYTQKLDIVTDTTAGNVITYEFVGAHDGAELINDSTVTFTKAGVFTIKGRLEKNLPYAAAEDTYTLTVTSKIIPHISYAITSVSCSVEDSAFTNPLTSCAGVGDTTYISTDQVVATVDSKGKVTPLKPGVTIIKACVAANDDYTADTASYTLTVLGKPVPGVKSVNGNIADIADRDSWSDNGYYSYFKLDNVISVSDSNSNKVNAQYLESEECVRFYQNQTKGQFFIRAKAGAIIQAVQFTYSSQNDGVITNDYGSDGKSIAENKRYLSGVTYKFDANKLTFYTGSSADKSNGEVHITGIAVKYFDPEIGEAVTKNVSDLAKQNGLVSGKPYQDVAVNNVIKLHADKGGTLKYYSPNQLNCYNGCGAIYIIAREGATINYVKVTYANGDGVLTENVDGGLNLSPAQYIASDSIMEVNNDTLRLYIGSKGASYQTLAISKFYVNYTDSKAIVDNFDNCTKIYGGDNATKVMGVDSTFEWEFTQFNRDSLRRIGYDQSTMLRQTGGKIAANNVDGGIKEVSFDWFASNSNQGVKFYVKAGGQTFTVDSAKAGGYYPITYTLTDIKTNGAFSIEMDPASGSQMEVGHISLTPYMFYKEKEANVTVGGTYKNNSLVDYRDSEDAISYESSKDSVASVDADGLVTANHVGTATITASWNGVSTSYTINVAGDKTTIVLKRNDGTSDADTLINNYGEVMPSMTLPTREGWRFNAYFPDAKASKGSERITVTSWDKKTYWVASCVQNGVTMTDANRKWVYEGPTHTLYANWKPELTISLNDQEATTSGTDKVITANCPNNASVYLPQNITKPVKAGFSFGGYYTEPMGQGIQLIDANGAFKTSVAGPSGQANDTIINKDRKWCKDEGMTLYAHWETITIELDEAKNNSTIIANYDGQVVGQVNLVRTLATDKYNTFCVPFSISKEDLESELGTTVTSLATLDENSTAALDAEKKNLNIMIKEVDSIKAGKPYLLWIGEEKVNPTFSGVTIDKSSETISSSDGNVVFHGITSPFDVEQNDKTVLFVSNNKLNWNNAANASIKGLRAYFKVPGMEGQDPTQVSARLVMNKPQVSTGMDNVNVNANANCKMIINNQLIIIRDGKMFNAQGALLK